MFKVLRITHLLCFLTAMHFALIAQQADFLRLKKSEPLKFVNPLIGTEGWLLYGRTTPFVTPPFGMTHWTACTRNSRVGVCGYKYLDPHIIGFRGTHKPAMWMGDYGYVTIMPGTGPIKNVHPKANYSHYHEHCSPNYYSVTLNPHTGNRQLVEITGTTRCGMFRISYPHKPKHNLFIEASQKPDFDGWIKIDMANREITGWNCDRHGWQLGPPLPHFRGYFVLQFNQAFSAAGTWINDSIINNALQQQANACGAWVTFANDTVLVKIGTSFISLEQARENLNKEIPHWSFEKVKAETGATWNNYLTRIDIEGASKKEKIIFYSAFYHALLFPRQFSEYGRYYSAFDDIVHVGESYEDYSLWDTYRAEHPLLTLVAPEHVPGMVQSLINMYKEGGYMPKWPNPTYTDIMIGTHADAVIADAVVKGFKGFDLLGAWEACMKDAMVPPHNDSINWWGDREPWHGYEARSGLYWYKKLGYVPADKTSMAVANSLEGSYDDFCVAQVAKAAGKMADYDTLMQRSKYYRNLYNPATGMMAPRDANGQWDKNTHAGFCEGGPWTYLFCVQQDIPGLIDLVGGNKSFITKLDKNFRVPFRYIHENEPGHHFTYLYDYAGAAWKTQKRVAHYRAIKYYKGPHGLTGDDDCGQMSAWYIFSALGFYPVTPGTDVYAIGTPLFNKSTVYFDPNNRSKKFEIIAKNVSRRNIYIQKVTLNGQPLDKPFLHHADIVKGGILEFEMGNKPRKDW